MRLTQPYEEAASAPPITPPRLLPHVTTQLTMPSSRPLRWTGAPSIRSTFVVVKSPPAPAPVNALPRMKIVALGAKPAVNCPVPKTTVATTKMEVGWKMVERRPTSGVVQELAICNGPVLAKGT